MIGKGNPHGNGVRLARYMLDGGDAELIEMRGMASEDLVEALETIQAIADTQTKCDTPFFHAYIRLADGENFTPDQWREVADRFEKKLGFEDQPRAITLHRLENGDRHAHIAWSRIDTERMCAIDPGLYKNKMVELCRELEVEYGLHRVSSDRQAEQQTKAPARPEFEQARRLGVDVEAVRENIRKCFDRSDGGPSFAAALAEHGLRLTRGDQRDFVVFDHEGGLHALGKRICGVSAAEIRDRIGEDFRRSLPTIEDARLHLAEHQRTRTGAAGAPVEPQSRPENATMSEIRNARAANDTGAGFALALEDRGLALAVVSGDEAAASRRTAVFAKAVGNFAPRYNEGELVVVNNFGSVYQLTPAVTGMTKPKLDEYLKTINPEVFLDVTTTREAMREASRTNFVDELARARPISPIEKIVENLRQTAAGGTEFLSELGSLGFNLARVTAADIGYIQTEEKLEFASGTPFQASMLKLTEGEVVAVSRFGSVHRLSPHKVDVRGCEALVLDGGGQLHSLEITRGDALDVRNYQKASWAAVREEISAARMRQARSGTDASPASHVPVERSSSFTALRGLTRLVGEGFSAAAGIAESLIGGLLDGLTGGGEAPVAAVLQSSLPPAPPEVPRGQALTSSPAHLDPDWHAELVRQQAIMEAAINNSQEMIDRQKRDSGREGIERSR